ncbi:MAG: hypothetical protein D6806_17135 [Deltaproteobacteria bacterium]|nr:MAG: hypothetical protein D6806_17135 [Deltaproteobacteria bacterium]
MAECARAARDAGLEDVEECHDIGRAAAWLAERLGQGCAVLVKGSRGMALERAVEAACRTLGCDWRAGGK